MNPLIQGHSGTIPETSRNTYDTKQGANEDDSQIDPHPEASISQSQMAQDTRQKGSQKGTVLDDLFSLEVFEVFAQP